MPPARPGGGDPGAHPLRYEELIEEKAGKYNLSPAFVAAIVLNESSFGPDAESSVGRSGPDAADGGHRRLDL